MAWSAWSGLRLSHIFGACGGHLSSLTAGISKPTTAAGQAILVKCESVGSGKRVSDGHSEHVNYTFRLAVGLRDVGTFVTRYSRSLQAHEQFVKQGLLPPLDPPLEFPPKYRLRNMTSDEGNVILRQHELQLYFERLLGVSLCCVQRLRSLHTQGTFKNSCTMKILRSCVVTPLSCRRPVCSRCQRSAGPLACQQHLARNLHTCLTTRDLCLRSLACVELRCRRSVPRWPPKKNLWSEIRVAFEYNTFTGGNKCSCFD